MTTKTAPEETPEETPAGAQEAPKTAPMPQQRLGSGVGRWGALGMPAEKTANFKQSLRRLLAMLRRERLGLAAVIALAVTSVTLTVLGPKLLGRATDVIFTGLTHGGPKAIDFASLHRARKPRAAKRQPDTPQSSTTDQSGRLHRSSQCPFVVTRRCRVQAHPKDGGDEQMFGAL